MFESSKTKAAAIVLGVLTVAGVAAWIYQLMNGLGVTGMSNATSWGLYITCFMFFVGLSAGGLIVASSASVFHIAKFKQVAFPAIIVSTVCICCAGMFILVDLGGIARVWRMVTGPNPISPLFWDICVIACYLVINVVYLVLMKKHGADSVAVARISRFALPVAILVHSVTAWIFGLQIAREGWYSAIMAPVFVASAMDSGLALLLIVLIVLSVTKVFQVGRNLIASLAGLLATCIAVDAFFIGCELLTMAYSGTEGGNAVLGAMFTGATSPFFWFEIVGGLLIPFCIMVFEKNRQKTGLVVLSSVLVVCGVFCKRIWLLLTSFITPNIVGAPGISLGTATAQHGGADMWALAGSYAPTWYEIVIAIGVVSLGVLAIMALSAKLLKDGSNKEASMAVAAEGAAA